MKLSIVIPALNEENYLPTLLTSLKACAPHELDIIVVEGKSDDRTKEVAEEIAKSMPAPLTLRVFTCDVRNVSVQRNLGAEYAKNDLILFLDADTRIPSRETLEQLIAAYEASAAVVASCRFTPIEDDWRARLYYNALYFFQCAMQRIEPYAAGSCIITHKSVFLRCEGFDHTIKVNEDANYCKRATEHGRFHILPISIQVSSRRFRKDGYAAMGFTYLHMFLSRTFRGEARSEKIVYKFGHYDK